MSLRIRRAELEPGSIVDLRIEAGTVVACGPRLPDGHPGEPVLDAGGGAVLPGLHDHHIHLLALAASHASLACGPPAVSDPKGFRRTLVRARAEGRPIRGVGYHESVAGSLDRRALDAIVPDLPVRIQHRSGACWVLNGVALEALDLATAPGDRVERGPDGAPTGRLFRLDAWLGAQGPRTPPDLKKVGQMLASFGVTGVTDATPDPSGEGAQLLAAAVDGGRLPQRVVTLASGARGCAGLRIGPRKIVLDEPRLPTLEALTREISDSHADNRGVAIHCVTRTELFFAIAALEEAGPSAADRIEHASVAPPEAAEALARLGVSVVTQPAFVHERGDDYLRDVDPADRPWLYRCQGLLRAGVRVGGGTDAPYGTPNPWQVMQAAVDRRTRSGQAIGPGEAVDPERALALFTTPPEAPGGAARSVRTGAPADLVLLGCGWRSARERLDAADVAATIVGGSVVWRRS